MNAERLLALAAHLIQIDGQTSVPDLLNQVNAHFQNLANQPQEANFQNAVATGLDALESALQQEYNSLIPAERADLETLGGAPYFSPQLAQGFRASMVANPMTPAVVRDDVAKTAAARSQFVESIQQVHARLQSLGFRPEDLEPTKAELGFLFPRELFKNDLSGLVSELKQLVFVLERFSEAATGSIEKINVGQISTTDPIFFLLMSAATVGALATAVKKVLDAIKTGLEIRVLYQQSKAIGLEEDALKHFESLIDRRIDAAIRAAANSILEKYPVPDPGRRNELETGLVKAMQWLAPRIERGLIVEVRQPPLMTVTEGSSPEEKATAAEQHDLAIISQQLDFPKLGGEPLLKLIQASNDNLGVPPEAPNGHT